MSERKKHTNRLLVFMSLLFLLSFLPWNTLNAKAAVTLSRKKMILTVNQKQYLRVKGPAGRKHTDLALQQYICGDCGRRNGESKKTWKCSHQRYGYEK